MTDKMRASLAESYGTPEIMTVGEVDVPTPAKDQVLVKVEASSLNALDWYFLTGAPYMIRLMNGLRRPKRTIRGADVAGTVAAIGSKVTRWQVGDEVFGEGDAGGGCASFVAVKEGSLGRKPAGVSWDAAAATPVAGQAALQALTKAKVEPGERVLINGASGGVGTFAVQVAKSMGAVVTGVCSTRNVDMVTALGADEVIDYTQADFVDSGRRFDVMMDNVGNRSARECLQVLKPGARYLSVSGPMDNRWVGPLPHMARTALTFLRADATYVACSAKPDAADLDHLGQLLADGQIVPVIDRVVGLDGVAAGLAEIGTGHARAKIVVRPSESGYDTLTSESSTGAD